MATEGVQANIAALLTGIDRYNPENLTKLERYVEMQCVENTYNLEANLAVLKLYQFNPSHFKISVTQQILMKALTNLPHKDFTLCKCLIDTAKQEDESILKIMELADLLETCQFKSFWMALEHTWGETESLDGLRGFGDSIRKFICHVVNITYQRISFDNLQDLLGGISPDQVRNWIVKYGWKEQGDGSGWVFIAIQDESVKTKNITEKITFESVAEIMAMSRPVLKGSS